MFRFGRIISCDGVPLLLFLRSRRTWINASTEMDCKCWDTTGIGPLTQHWHLYRCVPVVDACPSLSLQEDNITNSQQVDPVAVEASAHTGVLNGADLDVFAMQCSNDFWEGAYRTEIAKRRQCQSPSSQELIFRSPYENSRKSPNAQTTQHPNGGAHSSNSQVVCYSYISRTVAISFIRQ